LSRKSVQDDLPTDDHITFPKIKLTREEAENWWATLRITSPAHPVNMRK